MCAKLVQPTEAGIAECARFLRQGKLCAFPTETVYGLGANALDEKAVLSIYEAKGRPLTDPVIVHVPSAEKALDYVDLDGPGLSVFRALTSQFWPGPLTVVAPARPCLPANTHAGTGFVGVRIPNLALARRLLEEADVPVAAPSANRFGHISPTRAEHVMSDLGACDHLLVLDSDARAPATAANAAPPAASEARCHVGIESTVAKIDAAASQIVVYRRGGVSTGAIERALRESGDKTVAGFRLVVQCKAAPTTEVQEAPGQMLKHYAPDVDTYLLDLSEGGLAAGTPTRGQEEEAAKEAAEGKGFAAADVPMAETVLIDFGGRLGRSKIASDVLAYRDLAVDGRMETAARNLFACLRWAEAQTGAKRVLLVDVWGEDSEHTAAVRDRMFRSASGKSITLDGKKGFARHSYQ
jgi:tRNA threonylcarbamoyl adenosine modification protein (Sua5/YciO/YrdC/YwlC family)